MRWQICNTCLQEYRPGGLDYLLGGGICEECFSKINFIYKKLEIDGVKGFALASYTSPYKDYLIHLKENLDVAIAEVFLIRLRHYLRLKYHNYSLVLMPSSKEAIAKRGFNHLYEIFKVLDLPLLDVLAKEDSSEHKKMNHLERNAHQGFVKLVGKIPANTKRLLLVDDVISTGSSLKAALKVLKSETSCRIRFFTLMLNEK